MKFSLSMQFCESAILIIICVLSGFSKAEQPYTVKNERLEPFKGLKETAFDLSDLKIVGRQRYINGSVTLAEDMSSEHYKFQIEIFSSPQGDGQYKQLPMGVPRTPVCEGVKELYTKLLEPSLVEGKNTDFPHVPEDGLCPLPKGQYFVKDLDMKTDTWPNQIPRGLLKAKLTFFKDEVDVGGSYVIIRVEDRQ
ncbi:uncharacterized protein LOC126757280 [Bactrocera neohumeralis]|uniref:uncharacterized protein LOC126757280 n=1 Tax=Bactrocera neohumeralis TaxID=98809 RepID=UPI002165B85F|nr:uncharacterized protein LOC126757280 [Bactrocera neohumeralis]